MNSIKDDTSRFDHVFEGWSVWIEVDGTDDDDGRQLTERMKHLAAATGGDNKGVHAFVPHVTLLYNFDPPDDPVVTTTDSSSCASQSSAASVSFSEKDDFHRAYCLERLEACRKEYFETLDNIGDGTLDNIDDETTRRTTEQERLDLQPKEWMSFRYPKSANEGRGFGSAIGLMLIQESPELARLHSIVRARFPLDERSASFTPHMSVVYAPEDQLPYLDESMARWQEDRFLLDSNLRGTYLSVWSTQGRIQEWYRIARIPLVMLRN